MPSAFPEGGVREQHGGGAAGRGRLLAAGAVAGPAVPPHGRAGELPVRGRGREGPCVAVALEEPTDGQCWVCGE